MRIIVKDTVEDVCVTLAEELDKCAIDVEGVFRVGISGGSLPDLLANAMPLMKSDLSKWQFYVCDERYVSAHHKDSNFAAFKAKVFPRVPILSDEQCVAADTTLSLNACAADYEERILKEFELRRGKVPVFDVLLLGMGPDGHTCSLFPGHKLLDEECVLIAAVEDSPKPPQKRITMTFPIINNARLCLFALIGDTKADMVKRVFVDRDKRLPATHVNPSKVLLITDKAAGRDLE